MKVTVKYFGIIAELAGKHEELLELKQGLFVRELKQQQIKKYQIPDPESLQVAVNKKLNNDIELKENDEVAFLPPFAGG